MLAKLGLPSLEALGHAVVPKDIRVLRPLQLAHLPAEGLGEQACRRRLQRLAQENLPARAFIGMGYHRSLLPAVLARNVLEAPGWYTPYTPYQAEIAQGRLETLLNFQTLVADLTGLPVANASLLDEATAAAEAMGMCINAARDGRRHFWAAEDCHPQVLAVLHTRANALGIQLTVGDRQAFTPGPELCGALLAYPTTEGALPDYAPVAAALHAVGARLVVDADLLALTLLRPPGEFGADIAVGTAQRFGTPMACGGPHAAYLATRVEMQRLIPGRIIGVSRDVHGRPALRMALQTREQHIRRERATSNICTAQALLATLAGLYAAYHGPEGLRAIAQRIQALTELLAHGLSAMGLPLSPAPRFDTLWVALSPEAMATLQRRAAEACINLRQLDAARIGISLDEATQVSDVVDLWRLLLPSGATLPEVASMAAQVRLGYPAALARTSTYLRHAAFNSYQTEHEMLRYLERLQRRDLSLTHAMIPLGSCTMKLNAAAEMQPIGWPEFTEVHPFAPPAQMQGYVRLFAELEAWLGEITGFAATSLQPNAGSQGEYAGLLVIRRYHEERGEAHRRICLIPTSAHGTNPASAVMAGFEVVPVQCDAAGHIDLDDLVQRAQEHRARLGALMLTYPSTYGIFEPAVRALCAAVHAQGGQVYLDGANMNAQVGLCRPGDYGADVCHLNLHKTFCIPHGGGGPGVGPICVAAHLAPHLPGHPSAPSTPAESRAVGSVAAAPYGSAGILPIPWAYIAMMGADGLRQASLRALLAANYMAARLKPHFQVLYAGAGGMVGHEFILDLRPFKASAGIDAEDVAKRLMDYGLHAPTLAFPVAGTLMLEPTESESRAELDRYCDALIAIRAEIEAIVRGTAERQDNLLKNAPHTAAAVSADSWTHPYPRSAAAYPLPWLHERKFWAHVGRIDNAQGDRNLICTCPPLAAYGAAEPDPQP